MPQIRASTLAKAFLYVCLLFFFSSFFLEDYEQHANLECRLDGPSWTHILGCDAHGNDVLSLIIVGTQSTFTIAFCTVLLSSFIGILCGLICAFKKGWLDNTFMSLADLTMAFPGILIALAVASILEPSMTNIVIAISISGWTGFTRLVRSETNSILEKDYIEAARALGIRKSRIAVRHVLPVIFSPISVHFSFSIAAVILTESSLSFLGLGPQDSAATWGELLNQGQNYIFMAPHLSIIPGVFIMLSVLSLNMLGDTFNESLKS